MTTKPKLKDWIFATRPWSFTASAVPAFVAFLYIYHKYDDSHSNWLLGIIAILGAVIFHAGGNLLSDYYDYKYGVDREGTIGSDNLTSKLFTPKQIFVYGLSLVLTGVLIGLYLTIYSGIILLIIGLVGTIGTVFYYQFKFRALGDLLIFVIYGPTIMLGTGYVMHNSIDWSLLLVSFPIAFITVNILHSNNTRDIRSDKFADIKTFAMLIGVKASIIQYYTLTILAYLSIILMVIFGILPAMALVTLLTIPIAVKNCKSMTKITENDMSAISELDKSTAQLQFAFSGLLSLALIISAIVC